MVAGPSDGCCRRRSVNRNPQPNRKRSHKYDVDPAVAKGTAIDEWLAKHRQGENRDDWLAKAVEPLKKITKSATAEERVAAARALIPFGDDDATEQLFGRSDFHADFRSRIRRRAALAAF